MKTFYEIMKLAQLKKDIIFIDSVLNRFQHNTKIHFNIDSISINISKGTFYVEIISSNLYTLDHKTLYRINSYLKGAIKNKYGLPSVIKVSID